MIQGDTMGEILKANINQLSIWSENPRHIEATENIKLEENDVINILVSTVGYRYMYNLAVDIFNKGLMGNIMPVVVSNQDKYLVYDGNRRISAIKMLLDPSILDTSNISLRNLIEELLNNANNKDLILNGLKIVNVYSTSVEDALDIMDKTHNGIKDGVGTIPWDAYQRDKANSKRDFKLVDYPTAFKIVTRLALKKNDIKDDYTSYERIFNNSVFKDLFKISDYEQIDCEYLLLIFELLKEYKVREWKGMGLSRIFNKVNEAAKKFYAWAQPQLTPDNFISVKFKSDIVEIFKGQKLPYQKLQFEIIDYYGKTIINNGYTLKNYMAPNGENVNEIDTQIIGQWYYQVTYKSASAKLSIIVKELQSPVIMLKENKVSLEENRSITDLHEYIISATNSINENIISDVSILPTDATTLLSSNGSFLNTNQLGIHQILFEYNDPYSHKQASELLIIDVVKFSTSLSTEQKNRSLLSLDRKIHSKYFDNLSWETRELINEINDLGQQLSEFKYVIAASLRALVHLLCKDFCRQEHITFRDNISEQIKDLCTALINDFSNIHNIKTKETWVDQVNLKDAFRTLKKDEWLSDVLNCATHSAGAYLSEKDVESAAEKISQLIAFIAILIYKE